MKSSKQDTASAEMQADYWDLFSIADERGIEGINSLFNRVFAEAKQDHAKLINLASTLHKKIWQHYPIPGNIRLCELYQVLYEKTDLYAYKHLENQYRETYFSTVN